MEATGLIVTVCFLSWVLRTTYRVFKREFTAPSTIKPALQAYHEAIIEGIKLSERFLQTGASSPDIYSLLRVQSELERWEQKIQRLTRFEVVDP